MRLHKTRKRRGLGPDGRYSTAIPMLGRQFGEWTVISWAGDGKGTGGSYWFCRCSCGVQRVIRGGALRRPGTAGTKRCAKCCRRRTAALLRDYYSVRLRDGVTIGQLAEMTGLKPDTVYHRYIRGWPRWRLGVETQRRP